MPTHTKTCDRCGHTKPATRKHFGPNLRNRDRFKSYCRACSPAVTAERKRRKAERSRAWAQANRDKARASVKRTYEKNRRQRLAYMRQWRQTNKERIAACQREYAARKRREDEAQ